MCWLQVVEFTNDWFSVKVLAMIFFCWELILPFMWSCGFMWLDCFGGAHFSFIFTLENPENFHLRTNEITLFGNAFNSIMFRFCGIYFFKLTAKYVWVGSIGIWKYQVPQLILYKHLKRALKNLNKCNLLWALDILVISCILYFLH